MMKKEILIITTLLFTILVAASVSAIVRPNVMVRDFHIKQGTADVGKDFVLAVTLTNVEPAACAKRITATVQANAPFIMRGVSTVEAEDLCKGSSTEVYFPLKIDPTAKGGFYQLTITSNYETVTLAQFSSSSTLNLFVGGTPDIAAHIIDSEPIDTYPGDTATITVNIENAGNFQAQSVTAAMEAEEPLDVKWAKSFSSLGLLDPKQSKTAEFSIEVPKDADAKDYGLKMQVKYKDENLQEQIVEFPFNFHVREKAMFETEDAGSDLFYADETGKSGKILLKNTGTDAARKIKVKLLPQFPFSTDGSVRYIEILNPGESVPVDFTIDIDQDGTAGTYGLDVLMDFEDAQGKKLQDTAKVSFNLLQKSTVKAVFIDYWFLWAFLVVVIVLIVTKRLKKNKQ